MRRDCCPARIAEVAFPHVRRDVALDFVLARYGSKESKYASRWIRLPGDTSVHSQSTPMPGEGHVGYFKRIAHPWGMKHPGGGWKALSPTKSPWAYYREWVEVDWSGCLYSFAKAFGVACPLCKEVHPPEAELEDDEDRHRAAMASSYLGGIGGRMNLSSYGDPRLTDLCARCTPVVLRYYRRDKDEFLLTLARAAANNRARVFWQPKEAAA